MDGEVEEVSGVLLRCEIDGVPVFWQQGPAPLSAGLCFAVGLRDEDFVSGGITHLVEHLVMSAVPRSHLHRNALVDLSSTSFTATGRPEAVRDFLTQVCAAVSDVPTGRLTTEARVLTAEEDRSGGDPVGLLMLARYGATGMGLAGLKPPALLDLDETQVRAHASRWFTRERAALWLTGPPPEGLRLQLPAPVSGAERRRPRQRRIPIAFPALLRYPDREVGLSFEADRHSGALLPGLRILLERMEKDLRHVGGHTYDVDFHTHPIDGDAVHVAFIADAPTAEVPAVARGMLAALHRLAAEGPSQEELAHDLEGVQEHLADPRSAEGGAASAALGHLHGEVPEDVAARLRQLASLTSAQVAAALTTALSSTLMLVPGMSSIDPGVDLPQLPFGNASEVREVTGRAHRRRFRSNLPRGARLVSAPEGTSLCLADGTRLTVLHHDCVAVGIDDQDDSSLELIGADALTISLFAGDWKDGQAAVDTARRATTTVPRYRIRRDSTPS